MRAARALSIAASLAVLAAIAPPATAESRSINIKDSYFATRYLVITERDSVTWTNAGETGHTVTAFDGSYSSTESDSCNDGNLLTQEDCMEPGDTFERTFVEPGTYDYYCKIHGDNQVAPDPNVGATEQPCGMCARIRVNKKSSPTIGPTRSVNPTPRRTPSATASPKASKSARASASPTPTITPISVGSPEGGLGRGLTALLAIVVLGGAGYGVWRRYLAPR